MDWAMSDPDFRVDLFRFIDVLPMLNETEQVSRHVKEYLLKEGRSLPTLLGTAFKAVTIRPTAGIAARTLRKQVGETGARFIIGSDAKTALPSLKKMYKNSIAFSVDLLGEATLSDVEAEEYERRYMDLIDYLADQTAKWPADEMIETDHHGSIPRVNVSLKISALAPALDVVDIKGSVERLMKHVLPIFLHAKKKNVFVHMDLEQWDYHHITYELFEQIALHPEIKDWPHIGVVVQGYLKESEQDILNLLELAKRRGNPITIRLVKGAYWDFEVVHALQHGYEIPVYTDKAATDLHYEKMSKLLLENYEHLPPAFASHNLRSLVFCMAQAEELGVPKNAFEFQVLHGMTEPLRNALRSLDYRTRVYAPVGALLPGIAYQVRRLLENTANNSFLRMAYHDGVDINKQLSQPEPKTPTSPPKHMKIGDMYSPFENCEYTDFNAADTLQNFQSAAEKVSCVLPFKVPVVLNGQEKTTDKILKHPCPSDSNRIAAEVSCATLQDVEAAVQSAMNALPDWRSTSLEARAQLLEKWADNMQADRVELAAQQMWEEAKPWREADADVAEAIDFCRYYARQAISELGPRRQGGMMGEDSQLWYEGRGPTVVIAPWNFPLAILCGMAAAALVAGNPVILKPAEQSSGVAYEMYLRMKQAGFPPKSSNSFPASAKKSVPPLSTIRLLPTSPSPAAKMSDCKSFRKLPSPNPKPSQVKRVVCEMGGKNAIIVDDDSDLDEAISGVVYSAFGFAGQKCSACSRVLVLERVYDQFVERLIEATKSHIVTAGHLPECDIPPVIDQDAYNRLQDVIANPGADCKKLYIGQTPQGGWYVPPAIF